MIDVCILGLNKKSELLRNMFNQMEDVNFKGYLSHRRQCFNFISGAPVRVIDETTASDCDAIIAADYGNLDIRNLPDSIRLKIVDSSLFEIPNFNIEKYLKIVREKWCVVSEDCWGGLFYRGLNMEFTSPFINIYILDEDYYRLLSHLPEYLSITPIIYKEEDISKHAMAKIPYSGGGG